MNDRSFLIVDNPVAGRGRGGRLAGAVGELLRGRGFGCTMRSTSARGEAERIAADAVAEHRGDSSLCVVACGGDGTVHEVANALAHAGSEACMMGLAPAGRCNDFARALGVGKTCEQIVEVLANGSPRAVDLGLVGERYFCTVAAMGFDAAVSRYVNEMRMPLQGPAAYVYGTLQVLMRYRTPILNLSGDFGEYQGPVFMAASANTPWYGGAMKIAPDASAFDGQVDLCLVTDVTRRRVPGMLYRVIRGTHTGLPEVRMMRTRRLVARAAGAGTATEIWADGEAIGDLPAVIESAPGAIRVVLPQETATGR